MANNFSDQMRDEAVRWHVRLEGDAATEADWLAFTDWLEADDGHRLAYDALEDMLIGLDTAKAAESETDAPAAAPLESAVIDARHRFGRARGWAAAAVALAATIMAVVGIRNMEAPEYVVQEYATGVGEQRLVTLEDGSTVRLNTNSKIKVMFEDDARRTELAYGQAVYSVTKDADRPFLVGTGDSTVRVVGTVFDVLRHNREVKVTVAEGVVEVAPIQSASAQKTARLLPGSQLVHKEGTADIAVTKVDPALIMAWQSGYLEYDDARLADVVADLNRYFPTPIHVVGGAQELRFSGVVRTSDEQGALLILSSGLPIRVENRAGEIVLVMAADQRN